MMSGWSAVWVIAQFTLREAVRNRILWIAVVFSVIGIGLATFIGDIAIVEHKTVEVTLLAAAYRLCAVLTLMILVISTVVREFNDKCLELFLSLTISRTMYLAGKLLGFFMTGMLLSLIFGAVLLLYAETSDVLLWALSLACELVIVAAVSIFCVLTFNQQIPSAFAASLVFYLMCRSADAIVLISQSNIIVHTPGAAAMRDILDAMVFVLPSLSRFTETTWLAYGEGNWAADLPMFVLQTIIYAVLISAASLFDFSRKNI